MHTAPPPHPTRWQCLGLAFDVAAVPLVPRGPAQKKRGAPLDLHLMRLGLVNRGMGFVIVPDATPRFTRSGTICEYCTGGKIVTFLCSESPWSAAAIWGLGPGGR